eukprot:1002044-Pyramimonas_sp.AAC.1
MCVSIKLRIDSTSFGLVAHSVGASGGRGRDPGGALDSAPSPLLGGCAGEAVGGGRHRPPLHLRLHHQGAHRAQLRLQGGAP